jgi:hypothetical protein
LGLLDALLVTVRPPVIDPMVDGAKVTLTVQLEFGATGLLHVFVWPKLLLALILVTTRGEWPLLFTETVCAALVVPTSWPANVKLEGERPARGPTPVPARLTVRGLFQALSVTVMVPVRLPIAVGVKVTEMLQVAPGLTEPQSSVSAKSPLAATLVTFSTEAPLFVTITVSAALAVVTSCSAKVTLEGEGASPGPLKPVPLKATNWGDPSAVSPKRIAPVAGPDSDGEKATLIVHSAPIASTDAHVFVCGNAPELARLEMERGALPGLLTVTV